MASKTKRARLKDRPYFDLIAKHSERALDFRARNTARFEMFDHMMGYAYSPRIFKNALFAAAERPKTPGQAIEREFELLQAKVSTAIETDFHNCLYASVRLLGFGMSVQATILLRSAFEALQYFRLLYFDKTAYISFGTTPLRPVVVRKRLQELGHDTDQIRKIYADLSSLSHIGGPGSLDFEMDELDVEVVSIGGMENAARQDVIFDRAIEMAHLFQGFALGIDETKVADYFREIRHVLNDQNLSARERTERQLATVERFRFKSLNSA